MLPYNLYIEGMQAECIHCLNRKKKTIWGHALCAQHRKCTDKNWWNPKNCPSCLGQRQQLTFISEIAIINSFKELRTRLKGTQ